METIARSQYDVRPSFTSDLSFEGDKGVTKQSDMKDADINAMFKRFEKSGQLPIMIQKEPRYGDFSAVPEYQDAVNIVKTAEEQFLNLDVNLRNRFENDPAKFLAFATDENNKAELAKLGLLNQAAMDKIKEEQVRIGQEAIAAQQAKKLADEKALIAKIKAELANPA